MKLTKEAQDYLKFCEENPNAFRSTHAFEGAVKFAKAVLALDSQGSGWRPIADAPNNMAVVWLAFGNATKPWVAKGRKNGVGDWLDADTLEKFKYDSTPTHFMPCQPKPIPPLPSPPKGE